LVNAGEPALAQAYAKQWVLPDSLVAVAPAAVAAAAEARAAAHLPLALPANRVLLVDEEEQLDRCRCVLCRLLCVCMPSIALLTEQWRGGLT
jgi:hypothetical protein